MIRFYTYLLFGLGLSTFLNCTSKEEKEQKAGVRITKEEALVSVKTISPRVAIFTKFSREINKLSEENVSFHDLEVEVKKLNSMSVKSFSGEMEVIQESCNEFLKTIPKDLKNKSVLSRLDAIKNFAKAIYFEKKKGFVDTTKLHAYGVNLVESYNSLIVQLNDSKNKLPEEVKSSLKKTLEIKKDSVSGEKPLF